MSLLPMRINNKQKTIKTNLMLTIKNNNRFDEYNVNCNVFIRMRKEKKYSERVSRTCRGSWSRRRRGARRRRTAGARRPRRRGRQRTASWPPPRRPATASATATPRPCPTAGGPRCKSPPTGSSKSTGPTLCPPSTSRSRHPVHV